MWPYAITPNYTAEQDNHFCVPQRSNYAIPVKLGLLDWLSLSEKVQHVVIWWYQIAKVSLPCKSFGSLPKNNEKVFCTLSIDTFYGSFERQWVDFTSYALGNVFWVWWFKHQVRVFTLPNCFFEPRAWWWSSLWLLCQGWINNLVSSFHAFSLYNLWW